LPLSRAFRSISNSTLHALALPQISPENTGLESNGPTLR